MRVSVFLPALAACLLCLSCTEVSPFLKGASSLYDLETGAALTPARAQKAAGFYGTLEGSLFGSPQSVSFVRISPAVYGLDILTGEGESADSTSALCLRGRATAGINGSYFNMEDLTPMTYIKDNGAVVGSTAEEERFRTNGSLFINPDRLAVDASDTTTTLPEGERWWEVMTSGPILIDEGEVMDYREGISEWDLFYQYRHPRSLVGTDAEGYLWLVVVDGRAPGKADGMTIEELTSLALEMGLTDALNLDGGGSSTLWTRQAGVINHPCDNRRFDHEGQRAVPNVLAVR